MRMWVSLLLSALVVLMGVASGLSVVGRTQAQLANSAWPMFRHDLQHTGRSPYTGPQTPFQKWRIDRGLRASSPAVAADGTIYVGTNYTGLNAINPSGTLKWAFFTTPGVNMQTESSPAIGADGTIYVGGGAGDANVYAINPNGTQKWRYTTGGTVTASPAVAADGTIYIGSGDQKFYAINPDGSPKWSLTLGAMQSSPAIGADGTIYVGNWNQRIYSINPNGTLK